jgi:hypothetical protein
MLVAGRDMSDRVWRLVKRRVPTHVDPAVDGQDCYVFRRAGGERSTDVWTTHIIPVEKFWGAQS